MPRSIAPTTIRAVCIACALTYWTHGAHAQQESTNALSLAGKAELFQHDLAERFEIGGQVMCKLMLPTESRAFIAYNMPDNAYMTGMYLGTLAWQYAAIKDRSIREQASETLDALELLCTVSGKPGLLARAAWPVDRPMADDGIWRASGDGRYRWRGDVSSDQMTGVFFGLAMAHEHVADEAERKTITRLTSALADHLLNNDRRIIGYDGKPTQWGNYSSDYVHTREPMNALLFLQHMKVAAHVTGERRFKDAYQRIAIDDGYAELAVRARRLGNPQRVNHSDDVLVFLALMPLIEHEDNPVLRERYLASLRRAWNGNDKFPGIKPEANPLYAFAAAKYLDDDSQVAAAETWLRRFPLDMKWNNDTISNYEKAFRFTFDPAPVSAQSAPGAPVPIDRQPKTWSALVANPYREPGTRTADSPTEYNGHDYLISYWQGRYYGYISPSI